eukprot:jgi/Tetstr1/429246/TSEL_001909.t1
MPFKHNRPPPNFHNGISMHDATPAQLTFLEGEFARFVESGDWEFGTCRKWMETLLRVRHLTKKGNYMFSFDLQDGFYAPGIAEADRYYFTVDVRGGGERAPYLTHVDDFLLFSASMEQALHLRQLTARQPPRRLGARTPKSASGSPASAARHLGVDIDSASGMFYAPADKLDRLSRQATRLIGRATRNAR